MADEDGGETVGSLVDELARLEVERAAAERAFRAAPQADREAHIETLRALARKSNAVRTHLSLLWSSLVGSST